MTSYSKVSHLTPKKVDAILATKLDELRYVTEKLQCSLFSQSEKLDQLIQSTEPGYVVLNTATTRSEDDSISTDAQQKNNAKNNQSRNEGPESQILLYDRQSESAEDLILQRAQETLSSGASMYEASLYEASMYELDGSTGQRDRSLNIVKSLDTEEQELSGNFASKILPVDSSSSTGIKATQ